MNAHLSLPQALMIAKSLAERLNVSQCVYRGPDDSFEVNDATWAYENPLQGHYVIRPSGIVIGINGGAK